MRSLRAGVSALLPTDLNPVDRLWLMTKAKWFSGFYARTKDQLIDQLTQALRWLINRKNENTKLAPFQQNFRGRL